MRKIFAGLFVMSVFLGANFAWAQEEDEEDLIPDDVSLVAGMLESSIDGNYCECPAAIAGLAKYKKCLTKSEKKAMDSVKTFIKFIKINGKELKSMLHEDLENIYLDCEASLTDPEGDPEEEDPIDEE